MRLTPERRSGPELLDTADDPRHAVELSGSLSDIRKVNRYLGGTRAALTHFRALAKAAKADGGGPLSVLDVATGSADIPVELVKWARSTGLGIKVTAVDINPQVISLARGRAARYPEIGLLVADAMDLPFGDGSFDVVMCSMALHHLSEDEAMLFLKRAASIARVGYVVGDIRRSWVAFGLFYIMTRLLTKNRMTRYDGPLSVLKSFTDGELRGLAEGAGLTGFRVQRHPFWRMALVGGPHEA